VQFDGLRKMFVKRADVLAPSARPPGRAAAVLLRA
jgi:hypothetical protein